MSAMIPGRSACDARTVLITTKAIRRLPYFFFGLNASSICLSMAL